MGLFSRVTRFIRIFFLSREERRLLKAARETGVFDPVYYRGAYPHPHVNRLFSPFLLRHYIVYGERLGLRPNPDFSPGAYLRHNPDVAALGVSPLLHFAMNGRNEARVTKDLPQVEQLPEAQAVTLRFGKGREIARFAVVMHVYYPDLWPEFEEALRKLEIPFDLYVTLTYRGGETDELAAQIRKDWPEAVVVPMQNRGRDILPFMRLLNAGAFEGYEALLKIHTKKSPHREDGDEWRRHLIGDIMPDDLNTLVETFVADEKAAFWVADGQHYSDPRWWGSNADVTRGILRRLEIRMDDQALSFPAGSIYWMKPLMLRMLKMLHLGEDQFDVEQGQVDGTVAHALERVMGYLVQAADQEILQTTQLRDRKPATITRNRPSFVSAFYLPQFHPIPENDAWWGRGFTEWRGTVAARPMFPGHTQPLIPSDLGFYDLRVTEVMGDQAEMARDAGVDAFCVYHYWFDGRRVLEQPLDRLLEQPQIDFPFYLCWANESWRRNWDGLSGTVLLEQTYGEGFEEALARDALPYMQDPRYVRPDGTRPRFVIYRPEDMPDPAKSVGKLRQAWRELGLGEVELGAVCFHVAGDADVDESAFDFWIEMPPHGMVEGEDYLFGGPRGNVLGPSVHPGFEGLVYDYGRLAERAVSKSYVDTLPDETICGIMPSWDNTARRGLKAHVAYGANPLAFGHWLDVLAEKRLPGSYRQELFINAWNEWAEKAVMEPSENMEDMYLEILKSRVGRADTSNGKTARGV